tara:strand:+ start:428 stop:613 length:186 start_codon:yes stop_codon:yes gene_type:complete
MIEEQYDVDIVMSLFPKLNQAVAEMAVMENVDGSKFMAKLNQKKLEDIIFGAIIKDMSEFK